jgi:hypothetical protein
MQTIDDPTKPKRVPGPVVGDPNLAGGPPPPIPASPTPAPSAPAPVAPAPAGGQLINPRDPAYSGVNFDSLNSGDVVNGQTFAHNGQGWTVGGAPAPATAPGAPGQSPTLYKDALAKMLGDSQTPASLTDPSLKAQSDAFSVGQTRAKDRAREAMAERRSAGGGEFATSSGGFTQDLMGLENLQGEAEAGYNAGLVGDANKSKLQQMQAALAMMGNDMNSAEGRALQKQIADQEAELRRLGISTQADLGQQDLSLRDKLGTGGLNAQIMQMLMHNQQFGQNLSAQTGMFGANLNQQALLSLLGGL